MGTPVLDHWFSFSIRRNRKSFVLGLLALYAVLGVLYIVWGLFAQTEGGQQLAQLVFGLPAAICSYALTSQRLRDINISGWWALLWIPLNMLQGAYLIAFTISALLVLCAIPGNKGPNKYGPDPLDC